MRQRLTRRTRKAASAATRRPHAGARPPTRLPPEWGDNSPTWQARLKAAGFAPDDEPPADIDAFRNRLARRIAMFINNWHGCPQGVCRRQRGCMAPHNHCTNTAYTESTPEEEARALANVQRALREVAAQRAGEDGAEETA